MGDIISTGDICVNSGAVVTGSLLAVGNIDIQNNSVINGQTVAGGRIGFESNVTIVNDGNGRFGQRVGAARRTEGGN